MCKVLLDRAASQLMLKPKLLDVVKYSLSVCFSGNIFVVSFGGGGPGGGHLSVSAGPDLHISPGLEPGIHALPDQRLPDGRQCHRLHFQHHRHRNQPLLLYLPQPQI